MSLRIRNANCIWTPNYQVKPQKVFLFNQKSPPKLLKQIRGTCVKKQQHRLKDFLIYYLRGSPRAQPSPPRAQTSPKWWSPFPKGRAQSRRSLPNPIREAQSPKCSQCGHHQVQRKIPQKVKKPNNISVFKTAPGKQSWEFTSTKDFQKQQMGTIQGFEGLALFWKETERGQMEAHVICPFPSLCPGGGHKKRTVLYSHCGWECTLPFTVRLAPFYCKIWAEPA